MKEYGENEIVFIGKITAGVTHEINNALASIKEISGLLEDLISLSSEQEFPHREKFLNSLLKIKEQVLKSVNYTSKLNKFSHFTDNKNIKLDINEIVEHFFFITQRFARIKNVKLNFINAEKSTNYTTYPIFMEMLLYNCMMYFLNRASDKGKIEIQLLPNDQSFIISIIFKGEINDIDSLFKDQSQSEELININNLIISLRGTVEYDLSMQNIKLIFKKE